MFFRLFLFVAAILLSFNFTKAQKEHNNWFFGDHAAITFNTNPPSVLPTSSMYVDEGCASVSDSLGKLLFYTESTTVWDANHNVMPNGTGLFGHPSCTQSSIIIPHPLNYDLYYLFTLQFAYSTVSHGLSYSIVDMSQNGGLGAVTTKNASVVNTDYAEKLTVIRHANGIGYWVIVHLYYTNTFHAFEITATGVNTTPVVSTTGTIPVAGHGSRVGQMKGSPDGKSLAYVARTSMTTSGLVELADFDNATGIVSNARTLNNQITLTYGVEFSPNSSVLYVCAPLGLYQFDLNAGSLTAIQNSKLIIAPGSPSNQYFSAQLAPDNKIYISTNLSYLNRINAPDVVGLGCGYEYAAISLNTTSLLGLPNFVSREPIPSIISEDPNCFGDTTFFTFSDTTVIDSVLWDFGDPGSGTMNQSNLRNPFHIFSDTGTFFVSAIIDYTPVSVPIPIHATLHDTVRILPIPSVNLGPDTTICSGDTLLYSLPGVNLTYKWQNNSTLSYQSVTNAGTYWVKVTDTNQCINSDTVVVTHFAPLNIPYHFGDTSICKGDFFRLDATYPGVDYTWQDSSRNSFYDIVKPGKYWVRWENACESVSDTMNVIFLADINLDLGNDTVFCFGEPFLLNAGTQPEATYQWQDGSTASNFPAQIAGIYWVKVENRCESVTDSIILGNLFPPDVYLGEDSTLCRYNVLSLDAKNDGASYLWQDGSTGRYMLAGKEGDYWVDVTNVCDLDNDSILVLFTYPPKVDLGEDTIICNDAILTLDATNNGSTYLWQNGSREPLLHASRDGSYSVEVKNACGSKQDDINIRTKNCACPLFVPNAFTPGNDGVNESFMIQSPCEMTGFDLSIFNRWGEMVYHTNVPDAPWDGTYAGKEAPSDTYVWKLTYRTSYNLGKEETGSGIVNLIR